MATATLVPLGTGGSTAWSDRAAAPGSCGSCGGSGATAPTEPTAWADGARTAAHAPSRAVAAPAASAYRGQLPLLVVGTDNHGCDDRSGDVAAWSGLQLIDSNTVEVPSVVPLIGKLAGARLVRIGSLGGVSDNVYGDRLDRLLSAAVQARFMRSGGHWGSRRDRRPAMFVRPFCRPVFSERRRPVRRRGTSDAGPGDRGGAAGRRRLSPRGQAVQLEIEIARGASVYLPTHVDPSVPVLSRIRVNAA